MILGMGGEFMDITTVLSNASSVITSATTALGTIVGAVPMILLPAGFVFARKLIGMAKGLVFAGGRKRR